MSSTTPIEAFRAGELSLQELLARIDKTASNGSAAERDAIVDSWRGSPSKDTLDPHVASAIDRKMEEAFGDATRIVPSGSSEETVIVIRKPVPIGKGYVLNHRFVLDEKLGEGGMGTVYRAVDRRKQEAKERNPYVAIKLLNENFSTHPDAFIALERETRRSQTLAHPNIVPVYDFDRDGSIIYMTMEYLVGSSLDNVISSPDLRRMPKQQIVTIIQMIGAALSFAHENGIVHSDLKPANVFVTESGRVKVIDFGIARAVARAENPDTVFDAGSLRALSPLYASIEMIEGKDPDVRDDIFALGCISYELFTGHHPFGLEPANVALDKGLVALKPEMLNARQWKALQRALSFERKNRTPSVAEFIRGISAKDTGLGPQIFVLAGAAAALLVVGWIGTSLIRSGPPGPSSDTSLTTSSSGVFLLADLQAGAAADAERLKGLLDGLVQNDVKAEADRLHTLSDARVLASIQDQLQKLRPVLVRPLPEAAPPPPAPVNITTTALPPVETTPPRPLVRTIPPYPSASLRDRERGTVTLQVSIAADGTVSAVAVEKSSGYARLDAAAVQWVKQRWRYEPAKQGTMPVPSTAPAVLTFVP